MISTIKSFFIPRSRTEESKDGVVSGAKKRKIDSSNRPDGDFFDTLKHMEQLSKRLLEQVQETHDAEDVREQIVLLLDNVAKIEKVQDSVKKVSRHLNEIAKTKKYQLQGLCEYHSSPFLALGDSIVSNVLLFVDELGLKRCEKASFKLKDIINDRDHVEELAKFRLKNEVRKQLIIQWEYRSSPLISLGYTVLSDILDFVDEEALLACENASVGLNDIIAEDCHWERLAKTRNEREHPGGSGGLSYLSEVRDSLYDVGMNREGLVRYTKEKCRELAKSALQAKSIEACEEGSYPATWRIFGSILDGASDRDCLFIRLYWRQSNRVIWQGFYGDGLYGDEAPVSLFLGLPVPAIRVDLDLKHSPYAPLFNWKELSKYQSSNCRAFFDHDVNEEREFRNRKLQRLTALFQHEDFSSTILWRDEPVLVAGGVDRIYYDEDNQLCVALQTKNDVTAYVTIRRNSFYIHLETTFREGFDQPLI
jgi:hypothetical protein